jgi:drug/metabolite transporter (DMT)-like permease
VPRLRVHLALVAVALLFSLNYVASKIGMHAFTPLTFGYLRVLGSAIVLNVLPIRQRQRRERLSAADWKRVAGYSLLGVVINQSLFLGGLSLTSAHVAAILMTAIPVFALAAAIVLGRERATAGKVGGIALAFSGALLLVAREGLSGASKSLTGDLMLIGNAFAYALYLVLSKNDMARLGPRRVIARMFAAGSAIMLPLAAWPLLHEPWSTLPGRAWLALALVIAGPTVGAYVLNAWALAHAESSLVAAYTYLQPVATALLAAAVLGERIEGIAVAAAAVIFAGVALSARRD